MRKSPQELWPPVPPDPYRMSVSPAVRSLHRSVLRTYTDRPAVHTAALFPAVFPGTPPRCGLPVPSDIVHNRCEPVLPYLLRHSHFCAPPAIPQARENFQHTGTDSEYAAPARSPCLPGRNTPHRHGTVPVLPFAELFLHYHNLPGMSELLPEQNSLHRHPLKAAPVLPAEAA